ncbi:MAG: hypothetical protein AAF433_09280 [Bacteroidota bacterium]
MIRSLLRIGILLVIAVLGYNYFLGSPEEKAQSREIVGKVTDLGRDAWNLLRSERDKLREGKYDGVTERLGSLFGSLRDKARDLGDSDIMRRLNSLEERREALDRDMGEATTEEEQREVERAVESLTAETEALMNEMETKTPE